MYYFVYTSSFRKEVRKEAKKYNDTIKGNHKPIFFSIPFLSSSTIQPLWQLQTVAGDGACIKIPLRI
jgi:hypothetical protein